jgi:hypothetical protein
MKRRGFDGFDATFHLNACYGYAHGITDMR